MDALVLNVNLGDIDDDVFDLAVLVERRQRRQPAPNRGWHSPVLFHPACEQLQVSTLHIEEVQFPVMAPLGEDPQIGGVAEAGSAGVAGEERCDGDAFGDEEWVFWADDLGGQGTDVVVVGHRGLLVNQPLEETGSTLPAHARS